MTEPDDIEQAIVDRILSRKAVGLRKYGISVADRTDLSPVEWLTHFSEELMDALVYAEKLKRQLEAMPK